MTRRSFLRQPARAPDEIPRIKPAPVPKEAIVEFFDNEEFEQGGEAWFKLRLGMPTASVFAAIMADGEGRKSLLYKLAGEVLVGEPMESFSNKYMERGKEMEPEARQHYAFTRDVELEQVGFVRRTLPRGKHVGCSPDSKIAGKPAGLELKTMSPHLMVELIERGSPLPGEHRAQVQGTLWVTGWEWVDLMVFYRGMPSSPSWKVVRDEHYIARLAEAVERFQWDLDKLVERVRDQGGKR